MHTFLKIDGQAIPTLGSTQVTQPFSEKCGLGWVERPFSSNCYLFKNEFATKEEANSKCIANGGYLVSILDLNEQIFIQSTISDKSYNSNFIMNRYNFRQFSFISSFDWDILDIS